MEKSYILSEIIRTAEKNGGIPLGKVSFFKETGIKETDWAGIYWARWNDALKEAGFSPNQMNIAFTENHILESFTVLIRELGHIPVKNELKLKRKENPIFPSHNTFNRFGSKSQLLSKVVEFCLKHGGYEDVIKICTPHIKNPKIKENISDDSNLDIFGSVYLIKSGRLYKIGKTNSVGRREYEIALQLPEKPKIVHEIRTDDPTGIEAYWHNRFSSRRKNGEWFDLSRSDIAAFKRRKFQ